MGTTGLVKALSFLALACLVPTVEQFIACSYDGALIAEDAYGGVEGMVRRLEEAWGTASV